MELCRFFKISLVWNAILHFDSHTKSKLLKQLFGIPTQMALNHFIYAYLVHYLELLCLRWMICLGCIDCTIKYPKDWIRLPMYSSRYVIAQCYLFRFSLCFFVFLKWCIMMIVWLQHITDEGTALVQLAEESASNQV